MSIVAAALFSMWALSASAAVDQEVDSTVVGDSGSGRVVEQGSAPFTFDVKWLVDGTQSIDASSIKVQANAGTANEISFAPDTTTGDVTSLTKDGKNVLTNVELASKENLSYTGGYGFDPNTTLTYNVTFNPSTVGNYTITVIITEGSDDYSFTMPKTLVVNEKTDEEGNVIEEGSEDEELDIQSDGLFENAESGQLLSVQTSSVQVYLTTCAEGYTLMNVSSGSSVEQTEPSVAGAQKLDFKLQLEMPECVAGETAELKFEATVGEGVSVDRLRVTKDDEVQSNCDINLELGTATAECSITSASTWEIIVLPQAGATPTPPTPTPAPTATPVPDATPTPTAAPDATPTPTPRPTATPVPPEEEGGNATLIIVIVVVAVVVVGGGLFLFIRGRGS